MFFLSSQLAGPVRSLSSFILIILKGSQSPNSPEYLHSATEGVNTHQYYLDCKYEQPFSSSWAGWYLSSSSLSDAEMESPMLEEYAEEEDDEELIEEEEDFIADDDADISEDPDEDEDGGMAGAGEAGAIVEGGDDGGIAGGGGGGGGEFGLSSSSWKCDRTEAERQAKQTLYFIKSEVKKILPWIKIHLVQGRSML